MERVDKIKQALSDKLKPEILRIIDESHLHAGHKSAGGLGHYNLEIKSENLTDLSLIEAHRTVYQALGDLIQTDIHALSIKIIK
jgi:BolA protein